MKTPLISIETPEHDLEMQKQLIAYHLWEDEGRPEGKAEEHWQQACLVVMSLSEGEDNSSPVWLKRQESAATTETVTEPTAGQPTVVENLGKRSPARRAA